MKITKNTQKIMKIKKVCETCGSEAVWGDAVAEWDFEAQSWEIQSHFDYSWCGDCEAETYIIDQEYVETDHAQI